MRKHDVRKWLHAILDLLPVIIIPVFMVYIHRHDVTQNAEIVYKYQSNEVNSVDDLVEGNIYSLNCNGLGLADLLTEDETLDFLLLSDLSLDTVSSADASDISLISPTNYLRFHVVDDSEMHITIYNNSDFTFNDRVVDYEFFDTFLNDCIIQLLGGYYFNSPSLVQQLEYTDYNVIESVDISNTNVMDSFMNKFNSTIDNYFNMGNVFNLNGVYQWFNTNIFSGHAPTVIYSIWNIALYELIMDLLFLLYGLFMWFIDMIQKLMEKPINSVR